MARGNAQPQIPVLRMTVAEFAESTDLLDHAFRHHHGLGVDREPCVKHVRKRVERRSWRRAAVGNRSDNARAQHSCRRVTFEVVDLRSELLRHPLGVGIEKCDEMAAGRGGPGAAGPGGHGMRLVKATKPSSQCGWQRAHDLLCRAIVDEDDLEVLVGLREDGFQSGSEGRYSVEHRENHAD